MYTNQISIKFRRIKNIQKYNFRSIFYIYNNCSKFTEFQSIRILVNIGNTKTLILNIEKIEIISINSINKKNRSKIIFLNTLYLSGFYTNLVSIQRLEKIDIY